MKYFNTITQISVGQERDNPVFGECIRVRLEDEGGGIFLVLAQDNHTEIVQEVRIELEGWDNICSAVYTLKNQHSVK